MEFDCEKCAMIIRKSGKRKITEGIRLSIVEDSMDESIQDSKITLKRAKKD